MADEDTVAPSDPPDAAPKGGGVAALLTLSELRGLVRGLRRRLFAAGVAVVVGFVALLAGGMLTLLPVQGAYITEVIWWGPASSWWFYPEVLVIQPWGLLQLPLLPTAAMIAVAVASGFAATAGLVLLRGLVRGRTLARRSAAWAGAGTGAGPGLASVATLGACCCTSCASTGGLALVAAASWASAGLLLGLDWYLPLFQIAVVYVLLVAQERALRAARSPQAEVPRSARRRAVGATLRALLLLGGVTWSMAMFVEWGSLAPGSAGPVTWYHWLVEHQLLALTAVVAALFPAELQSLAERRKATAPGLAVRALLAVGAITWGVGVPPGVTGLGGFGNELLGALGVPAALGGIPPDAPVGAALLFHWALQHLVLAGFAFTFAVRPATALGALLGDPRPQGVAGRPAVPGSPEPSPGGSTPSMGAEPVGEPSG